MIPKYINAQIAQVTGVPMKNMGMTEIWAIVCPTNRLIGVGLNNLSIIFFISNIYIAERSATL